MRTATIDASGLTYRELNARIRDLAADHDVLELTSVRGHRYIGTGTTSKCRIDVHGTPGQDLGVFLDGPEIRVFGNAQDGVGNTMNSGRIVVDGCVGHIAAMSARGGRLFVRGHAGPRAAVHMKSSGAVMPVVVIGGSAGPFLGEYMSGGVVVVLNVAGNGAAATANPTVAGLTGATGGARVLRAGTVAAGIHGGTIFIRGAVDPAAVWDGAQVGPAGDGELRMLSGILQEFCECFSGRFDYRRLATGGYTAIRPRSHKPYSNQYWHEG